MKLFSVLSVSAFLLLTACESGLQDYSIENTNVENIIGGVEVTKKDPRRHYVAKLEISNGSSQNTCTASHVGDNLLLTAAHCFFDSKGKVRSESSVRVIYNSDSWKSQSRTVKKIVIHKDYLKDPMADLALVRIYGLAPDAQTILPVSFEKPQDEFFKLLSIGYGITNLTKRTQDEPGNGLGVLRAVETQSMGYMSADREFVIVQVAGKGINGGDSGGPGIYFDKGQPTIIGIAKSVSPRKGKNGEIRYDLRGTYVATYGYKDWIVDTMLRLKSEF